MEDNVLSVENMKKEVHGRELINVKLKDMVELLNQFRLDLNNENLSEEKNIEECNSILFNPLMQEYMGYRKAYAKKAITKEEFKSMVKEYVMQEQFLNLYEKAIELNNNKLSDIESEEMAK